MRTPKELTIMAVDDEPAVLFAIQNYFKDRSVQIFTDSHAALSAMQQQPFDILIVDQVMPGMTGLDLLTEAKHISGYQIGILISAFIEKDLLEEMVNENLISYVLEKPLKFDNLKGMLDRSISTILERERQLDEKEALKQQCRHIHTAGQVNIISKNARVIELLETAAKMASSKTALFLTGESGVGKEIFAYWSHFHGKRSKGPFIKINCSAIPGDLFEAELFGYEKGAFTGADKTRVGKFELAHGGTLFMDEVGDLPLSQQAKLLSVLEDKMLTRLGGSEPIRVDTRVVSATNRDLSEMVKNKEFREDLFYRLNVLNITIPPLRKRTEDIPLLVTHFLSKIAQEEGGVTKELNEEAISYLSGMAWPGNIRELQSLMHRLYFSSSHNIISKADIEEHYRNDPTLKKEIGFFDQTRDFQSYRSQSDSLYLSRQLAKFDNNLAKTARALGMAPSNLSRKLKALRTILPTISN